MLLTYRRGSTKCLAVGAIVLSAIVCLYYVSLANQTGPQMSGEKAASAEMRIQKLEGRSSSVSSSFNQSSYQCPNDLILVQRQADVDTAEIYQKFDFQPAWMKTKEYWDDAFEKRFEELKGDKKRRGLKVILVPHSHNDPGWLKTFEHYFESETKNILNQLVNKMKQFKDFTFIWSEISFLQSWWDQVHPTKQKAFKKFVQSGRIEITTGGWVMTDEANVHLYAMWDQLVEGHQWLKLNLNTTPTSGWSIDPFGHGSTFPYILSNSGFHGTIIQRIHYAWKQWFAWKRYGDFMWIPGWEVGNKESMRSKRSLGKKDVENKKVLEKDVYRNEYIVTKDGLFLKEDSVSKRQKRQIKQKPRQNVGRDLSQNKLYYLNGVFNGKFSNNLGQIRSRRSEDETKIKIQDPEILAEYEYLRNLDDSFKPEVEYDDVSARSKRDTRRYPEEEDDDQVMQESVQYSYVSENGKMRSDTDITYEVRLKRDTENQLEPEMRSKRSMDEDKVRMKRPKNGMLTHNMPFDIYSIKHSCGPHPYTCLNFDFRKIKGEYTEYSIKAQFIDKNNIREKADLLLEQYARAASLFPHNVALVPIGDDFRYNHEIEFDQQYSNYKMLVDYINSNPERYGTEISFGTPRDYFEAIENRMVLEKIRFPTVTGDFFVYSDIFTEGRPAYWSGYFTTRPFLKILDRTVEHNLRNAEILYTMATNRARQLSQKGKNVGKYSSHLRLLEKHYDGLTRARRHLALFQHHDAITGTSKQAVMRDYGLKLFEALQVANQIQEDTIESLLVEHREEDLRGFILRDVETESYDKLDRKMPILMSRNKRQIVLFNSLPQERSEIVIIRVNDTKISIVDDQNKEVRFQISPVWNTSTLFSQWIISDKEFEVSFLARLPPLSLSTYSIIKTNQEDPKNFATIYCDKCSQLSDFNVHNVKVQSLKDGTSLFEKSFSAKQQQDAVKSKFQFKPMQPGDVQLENKDLRLLFDGRSGFLKSITHKSFLNHDNADGVSKKYTTKNVMCNVKFGAYQSAQFHSGAYLFKPDPNTLEPEKDILNGLSPNLMIISGPVSSELTALYTSFISHTTRIYNLKKDKAAKDCDLMRAVYLETFVDFGEPPKNRETEMFLRLQTDVENGDLPVFYTDSNSFQYQKRTKIPDIGVEGNYYPITSMAFIQDSKTRLTLITDHAQGSASLEPGQLEVMLDRRTLYDDSRGMGEGLVDNKPTVFKNWLLVESVHSKETMESRKPEIVNAGELEMAKDSESVKSEEYQLPSLSATRLADALNYPVNVFTVEEPNASSTHNNDPDTKKDFMTITEEKSRMSFLSHPLPCDMRLVNFRTTTDELYHQFPWSSALMMLHRQGYSCQIGGIHPSDTCHALVVHPDMHLVDVGVKKITQTALTGVEDIRPVPALGQISVERMDLATYRIDFDE